MVVGFTHLSDQRKAYRTSDKKTNHLLKLTQTALNNSDLLVVSQGLCVKEGAPFNIRQDLCLIFQRL